MTADNHSAAVRWILPWWPYAEGWQPHSDAILRDIGSAPSIGGRLDGGWLHVDDPGQVPRQSRPRGGPIYWTGFRMRPLKRFFFRRTELKQNMSHPDRCPAKRHGCDGNRDCATAQGDQRINHHHSLRQAFDACWRPMQRHTADQSHDR